MLVHVEEKMGSVKGDLQEQERLPTGQLMGMQ